MALCQEHQQYQQTARGSRRDCSVESGILSRVQRLQHAPERYADFSLPPERRRIQPSPLLTSPGHKATTGNQPVLPPQLPQGVCSRGSWTTNLLPTCKTLWRVAMQTRVLYWTINVYTQFQAVPCRQRSCSYLCPRYWSCQCCMFTYFRYFR